MALSGVRLYKNLFSCRFNVLLPSNRLCLSSHGWVNASASEKPIFLSQVKHLSTEPEKPNENLGVVARFKQMYKDYWYVLVPVHLVTSVCWFGSFYYLAKSGVDVIALLKSIGLSDKFVDPLKDSSMGYYALAYGMYKVATPIRYTVTLGGTTISINYLKNLGYIKPMPSREKMKEMYQETKQELRQRKHQFRERKGHVLQDIARYKQEMKNIKESELKNETKNS